MPKITIQIYEVQTPAEAQVMAEMGVDHIGSVVVSETRWKVPAIRDTVLAVRASRAKSSLILLFHRLKTVLCALDYYQPDILHFCEALTDQPDIWSYCQRLIQLQEDVKKRFPEAKIMRSIPVVSAGESESVPTFDFARRFEPVSDFFLTDTLLVRRTVADVGQQPVEGFVGITGQTCNWDTAANLVKSCRLPVILAGGISPQNVKQAIVQVKPWGVDSCTQTNATDTQGNPIRFRKDFQKVKQFIDIVRQAEQNMVASNKNEI
jgi:phosphoribosylanthranilate isomerase